MNGSRTLVLILSVAHAGCATRSLPAQEPRNAASSPDTPPGTAPPIDSALAVEKAPAPAPHAHGAHDHGAHHHAH